MKIKNFITGHKKTFVMLLSIVLLLMATVGGTFAYIVTKTPSLLNTFLSGLEPDGDLTIRKVVEHPFGPDYVIPENIKFDFIVNLGADYVGKTVKTSQGDKLVDENGAITVALKPDEAVKIEDILEETEVTVTENLTGFPGFAVKDDMNPKTVTMNRKGYEMVFTNTYTPAKVANVNMSVDGTKTLTGREWKTGDSFAFLLEYKAPGTGAEWQQVGNETVAYAQIEIEDPNTPGTMIWVDEPDFDKFDFTVQVQAFAFDVAGTYAFRLTEAVGAIPGVSYDTEPRYFDVLVGDADMDGYLEIQSVTTPSGGKTVEISFDNTTMRYGVSVPMENKYSVDMAASAKATIQIKKKVTSRSGEEKSLAGYTFELYENGNLVKKSGETSAAGEAVIEIGFTAEDAGKTSNYVLKETNAGQKIKGILYDNTEYPITVSVVDNLDGTISARVYETPEPPVQTVSLPTEEPETTVTVSSPSVPEEELTVSSPSVPAEDVTVSSPSVKPNPAATLDLTTVPASGPGPEIPAGASDTYTVTFENIYEPEPASASFTGTKKLTGRILKTGEFSFDLYKTDDAAFVIPEGANPVLSVTNNTVSESEGAFTFAGEKLTYDKAGTYYYVVKEDDSAKTGGISYDETVFHITINVIEEDGALKALTEIADNLGSEAELIFENTYVPKKALLTLGGTKKLNGADLKADMFDFLLYQADGKFQIQGTPLESASNKEDGSFAFGEMKYTEVGEHFYVIAEDASEKLKDMTYDDTTYGVKVTVEDNLEGQLVANVAFQEVGGDTAESISFENTYIGPAVSNEPEESNKPEETDKPESVDSPETSDDNNIILYVAVAAVSMVAIAILLICSGKKKDR